MSPEAQNIAIAKACGHKYHKPTEEEIKSGSYYQYEPDYVNDLNLMRSAEGVLSEECLRHYHIEVIDAVGQGSYMAISASPAHRAYAFLRTLGLWHTSPTTPAASEAG